MFFTAALLSVSVLESCRADAKTDAQRTDEVRAARYAQDNRLFDLAATGRGNPEGEAATAVARGDFRFIGYSLLVPGMYPAAYGVECRPPIHAFGEILSRATYAQSDMPPVNVTEAKRRAQSSSNHATFGSRYNHALIADPRFPYRDFCRPSEAQQHLSDDFTKPVDYGFRDLTPLERPTTLGEAARRGAIQSLSALITSQREELNQRDTFGMTPLSWAIAYGHRENAQLLLQYGARALPTPNVVQETDPIRLARDKGWRDMVKSMLAQLNTKEQAMLSVPPKMDERDREFGAELGQLKPSRSSLKSQSTRYNVRISVSLAGKATECLVEPEPPDAPFAKRLCWIILQRSHWTPARNAFGDEMPGIATLPITVRSN